MIDSATGAEIRETDNLLISAMLIPDPDNIRLAMLGMVDGNGHPYSWTAIINGKYDAGAMAECGYPVIPQYLGKAPPEQLGIPGGRVTHVWCDDPADAAAVAKATCLENILERPEDAIGLVDAVIIPTDRGWEHVERVRPFIEAGLPVFIDKPMCDNEDDLKQFVAWHAEGKPLMSSSAMRHGKEFRQAFAEAKERCGQMRLVTMTTPKSWERYGIHALEAVYPDLRVGGWLSVTHSGDTDANIMHCRHADGVEVVLAAIADMYGGFGKLTICGTQGTVTAEFQDTFYAFRTQLVEFIEYLRTGREPFPFDQTVELMKIIIAGLRSREEGGRTVLQKEIGA